MPTVDVDGVRVEYADAGRGVPIVFLPGLVGSKEWFAYQSSGLAQRYRIISCDLRRAGGRNYSIDVLAGDVARLLDRLRIGAAVIAGHEFGALVAMLFAAERPERTLALILCSAAPSFAGFPPEEILAELLPGELKIESFFARLIDRILRRKHIEQETDDPVQHNACIDRHTLNARVKLLRQSDLTPVLNEMVAPTLVVAGSRDNHRILAGSQTIDQLVPDSTLEVLEGADHFCFYTRHDLFNSTVDEYVSRTVPTL